jgi:hypothetical protein
LKTSRDSFDEPGREDEFIVLNLNHMQLSNPDVFLDQMEEVLGDKLISKDILSEFDNDLSDSSIKDVSNDSGQIFVVTGNSGLRNAAKNAGKDWVWKSGETATGFTRCSTTIRP